MVSLCVFLLSFPALIIAQQYGAGDEFYSTLNGYGQFGGEDEYNPEFEYQEPIHATELQETLQHAEQNLVRTEEQQQQQETVFPVEEDHTTEPTEPGPLDCREEQYPCTRLYSVHKPCRQCIKSLCFYNLRRVYVINKEVCVRTVCAHEELLRADLCRDQFSKCSVMAHTGLCGALGSSCAKSCGGC
ncbi:microfibrillar-associated protein 2 [Erpetoichthys calabaricus]|uniref:microfibrillar-associated protein 2 n=1 Tax=Erpetoichthys calabaricus TaxID=27687 RepID=UPI00109F33BF|nr:microfibrillar-associated protein 2 [Erpetoichthys calabaricus]